MKIIYLEQTYVEALSACGCKLEDISFEVLEKKLSPSDLQQIIAYTHVLESLLNQGNMNVKSYFDDISEGTGFVHDWIYRDKELLDVADVDIVNDMADVEVIALEGDLLVFYVNSKPMQETASIRERILLAMERIMPLSNIMQTSVFQSFLKA